MHTLLRSFLVLLLISLISSSLRAATVDERVLLYDAVTRGDAIKAREILEKSPDVAAAVSYRERSLAEEALWTGSCEVMEVLLSHGVPLSEDILPLAATFSRMEMIELLLRHGAPINGRGREGYTALYNAAWSGRLDLVKMLLAKGADSKIAVSGGKTILHSVVIGSNLFYPEIAEIFIQRGADLNAKNSEGETPLSVCCYHGANEVINVLCRHGAATDSIDEAVSAGDVKRTEAMIKRNRKLLFEEFGDEGELVNMAARRGRTDVVALLLSMGAAIEARDVGERTPLHLAVSQGHRETAALLLSRGASVSAIDGNGATPLHLAATANLATLLIEKGAKIEARDRDGNSPLHRASLRGAGDVVEILIKHGASVKEKNNKGLQPLDMACDWDNYKAVQCLLEHGAVADVEALCTASEFCRREMMELLISHGAPVTAKDRIGGTALHYAARKGNMDAVRILIENGADCNVQDRRGITPFQWAAWGGSMGEVVFQKERKIMLDFLLSKGASVSSRDSEGRTPLSKAFYSSVAELLIDNGADVNSRDSEGCTPLHHIAEDGTRPETAQLLIMRGAEVNVGDREGWTPLHWACRSQKAEMVELLLAHNADVKARDAKGKTPLSIALQDGREEVVKLLLKYGATE